MTTRSRAHIQDDHLSTITDCQSLSTHSFDGSEFDDDITVTSRDLMTSVNDDPNYTAEVDLILLKCSKLTNSPAALNTKKKTLTGAKKTKVGQCPDHFDKDDLRETILKLLPAPLDSDLQNKSLHQQQVRSLFCLAKTIITDKPTVDNDRQFLVRTIIDAYPQKAFFQLLNRWARSA